MARKPWLPSEDDRLILKQLIREYKSRIQNLPTVVEQSRVSPAPEVYVAKVPDAGIPPIDLMMAGTAYDDQPGFADCDIYKLDANGDLVPAGFTKRVYNMSLSTITDIDNPYVSIQKDKFGTWWATPGSSQTGTGNTVDVELVISVQRDQPVTKLTYSTITVSLPSSYLPEGTGSTNPDVEIIDILPCGPPS